MQASKIIEKYRIIPVVVINRAEDTLPLMQKLLAGGLPVAEITFRTPCAKEAIEIAVREFSEMLIGAGTVINAGQCRSAAAAGARFIVSPGFSREVAETCKELSLPYYPGCVTPSEIMDALSLGLNILKFFPAQVYGGLSSINALGAAFPSVKFIPTGGVDNSNLREYLSNPRIYAVGGSFMMKGEIEKVTAEAVKIAMEASI